MSYSITLVLKEINLSKLCREALDMRLRLVGDDSHMLKEQLINNEKQIQILTLENKLILILKILKYT